MVWATSVIVERNKKWVDAVDTVKINNQENSPVICYEQKEGGKDNSKSLRACSVRLCPGLW